MVDHAKGLEGLLSGLKHGVQSVLLVGALVSNGYGVETSPVSPHIRDTSVVEVIDKQGYTSNYFHSEDFFDATIQAIFTIESNNDPNATRYEKHINDMSVGLGQLLTTTARELEAKYTDLPRLGNNQTDIINSLKNPQVNEQYTRQLYFDLWEHYQRNPFLAVAAYNAGPYTPQNARIQAQLNHVNRVNLKKDGNIGPLSRQEIRTFQQREQLPVTGSVRRDVRDLLDEQFFIDLSGLIPHNIYTPNHVRKFYEALLPLVPEEFQEEFKQQYQLVMSKSDL